ncbi:hypothetical protein PHLGIDRAFT_25327 [Phlebiopsis gigantea 11061_1 CR5-6]|uniref:Dienelactone hydrolase domain-containing protein n=1 Tax=Phlebiopsis gigantea (strain 11061_1 CR5-6) TaxID=745531 RepID=A0A0C3S7Y8_PHLG1|nr:hypothetical protein PHLGIDRAFT_25327 [Phlebiopsis gigantea 11061_1 CR5-6]
MSTTPDFCENCYKAVLHEGEPQGTYETIGGIHCYVATPQGDYPKDKVVLYLTDVLGIALVNNRTVMPDILHNDPITEANLKDPNWSFQEWIPKHGPETWESTVDNVVAALKDQGVTRIGTTGYCFGAPPAFYLAYKNEAHVTVVAHPSRIAEPEHFERYKATSKAPLLINSCEIDPMFPLEAQAMADEIMGGGKFVPGYERTYWEGCTHGFATKGDLSNPKVTVGKEGAFKASVQFFKRHL